jgi:hypothetical protein
VSQENVEVVRAVLDAYNRRDLEATLEHVTDGFELDWSRSLGPLRGVYRGRQGVDRLYREYAEAFANVQIEVEEFIDAGDAVVVPNVGRVRGRDGIGSKHDRVDHPKRRGRPRVPLSTQSRSPRSRGATGVGPAGALSGSVVALGLSALSKRLGRV